MIKSMPFSWAYSVIVLAGRLPSSDSVFTFIPSENKTGFYICKILPWCSEERFPDRFKINDFGGIALLPHWGHGRSSLTTFRRVTSPTEPSLKRFLRWVNVHSANADHQVELRLFYTYFYLLLRKMLLQLLGEVNRVKAVIYQTKYCIFFVLLIVFHLKRCTTKPDLKAITTRK